MENMNKTARNITYAESDLLLSFAEEMIHNGNSEIKCPRCGNPLTIKTMGNSYTVFCKKDSEVRIVSRGI